MSARKTLPKLSEVSRVCQACGGVMVEPKPSQLKAYPGAGKFCCDDCRHLGKLRQCTRCDDWFRAYAGIATLCPICTPKKYLDYEPVIRKAWSLGANILGGKGKKQRMAELIQGSLATPCRYCGVILTLGNLSLDHIEPVGSSELRKNKLANKEARAHADRWENLQIICRDCNQLKGKILHTDFEALLALFRQHPALGVEVTNRMRQGTFIFARGRRG